MAWNFNSLNIIDEEESFDRMLQNFLLQNGNFTTSKAFLITFILRVAALFISILRYFCFRLYWIDLHFRLSAPREISKFHLISWGGNFVERHSFLRVSGEFPYKKIRWNFGIFTQSHVFLLTSLSIPRKHQEAISFLIFSRSIVRKSCMKWVNMIRLWYVYDTGKNV